jgi:cellobiose-specific phosphotransferase system component IIA
MALQTQWFSHLKDKQEQEQFKQNIRSSKNILDRAHEIVYNIVKNEELNSLHDYDSPSWSHKQAHLNGRREAFQEILKLLDIGDH